MIFMFLRFSQPQKKIHKNQFLHFCKFKFQEAQRVDFKGLKRGIYDIHVFEIFSAAKEDTVFGFSTKTLYIQKPKNKFIHFFQIEISTDTKDWF